MKKVYCWAVALFFVFVCMAASSALAAKPTVTLPNGGETIKAGDTYTVQWSAAAGAVTYNLYFSTDNGITWSQINTSPVSATSHDWNVPMPLSNKKKCRIKVKGYDGSGGKLGSDVSDAPFTISVVNVTSPNGGEIVDAGSIIDVTWSTDTSVPVSLTKLIYTTDDGITWNLMAGSPISGNPGTYQWTVPQISSSRCRVKVVLLKADDTMAATDKGNANFTIRVTLKGAASFSGEYFRSGVQVTSDVNTQLHDFTANGNGTINFSTIVSSSGNSAGSLTYSMSPNGRFDVANTSDGDVRHGVLSMDNEAFLILNTTPFNGIGIGMGLKAASGLDNSALNGTYVMGSINKHNDGAGSTDIEEVTFDGTGNATVHCLSDSGGACFADFGITYAVSSSGRITTTMPGWTEDGSISEDGKIFTVVATSTPDNTRSFRVGMKKASGGLSNATFAGKFVGTAIGGTISGLFTNFASIKSDGAGNITIRDLYNSFGGLKKGTATYTIGPDGTFNVQNGSSAGISGVMLDNGQAWFVVDTDASDGQGEIMITIGLKTAK